MSVTTFEEEKIVFDFKPWGSTARRSGWIESSELSALVAYLFPAPVQAGSSQTDGAGLSLPGYSYLFADSIHAEPDPVNPTGPNTSKDIDTLVTHPRMRVEVMYITPKYGTAGVNTLDPNVQPYNPDPVTLLDHKWAIGAEYLTIRPDGLVWSEAGEDPIPDDIKIGIPIPTIEHQITWPYVMNPPFSAIRNCIGKVNASATTYQTGLIKAETLLFIGAELQRQILSNGERAWQVTYRFSERPRESSYNADIAGWNVFYNPFRQKWDRITKSDLFGTIFETVDFTTLYQVSQAA